MRERVAELCKNVGPMIHVLAMVQTPSDFCSAAVVCMRRHSDDVDSIEEY